MIVVKCRTYRWTRQFCRISLTLDPVVDSSKDTLEAVVLIHSYPPQEHRRDAIRNTWGSPNQCRRQRVVLRFVMGRPRTRQQALLLKTELKHHRDMLIGNFSSGIKSTSLQTFLALDWYRQFCPPAPYLVQGFDNTFMRLDKLGAITSSFLKGNNSNTIIGFCSLPQQVVNATGDSVEVNPNSEVWTPFCNLGAGFVMPTRMAQLDYSKVQWETTYVPFIDVHYALAAEKYNWTIRHDGSFSLIQLRADYDACIMKTKFTAISPFDTIQLHAVWKKIKDPNFESYCKS